jgi:hypothetical protein
VLRRTPQRAECVSYSSSTPNYATSSRIFYRYNQPIKPDQAIDRQHRTGEEPSADLLKPHRTEQTSLRIHNVKCVHVTLLQPLNHEVSETGQKNRARHASADTPDGDGEIGMIVFYVVELDVT